VRRKSGNRKVVCSRCGRRMSEIREVYEREVRDLDHYRQQQWKTPIDT
jgi:hypothetical protein